MSEDTIIILQIILILNKCCAFELSSKNLEKMFPQTLSTLIIIINVSECNNILQCNGRVLFKKKKVCKFDTFCHPSLDVVCHYFLLLFRYSLGCGQNFRIHVIKFVA